MLKIEKTRNTNDTAVIGDAIALNINTSVKIADANPDRIFFYASNDGATEAVWIKLQATGVDNDMKGIYLNKKGTSPNVWEMPPDNIYTGEICAIADANTPDVYVTEY